MPSPRCDYGAALRAELRARGLEPDEVWRAEMLMEVASIAQAAAEVSELVSRAARRAALLGGEVRSLARGDEIARPDDLAAAAEIRIGFALNERAAVEAIGTVIEILRIARLLEIAAVGSELRDEAPALRAAFPEEWALLADVLNSSSSSSSRRDNGAESLTSAATQPPSSSMPHAQCLMPDQLPDQSWMNVDATAHNDNRALVSIMIEGPPIKGDRVELRGVAYFKFPTRVDRDDCGAEWEPNGELAYSPRRGAGTWVEVPVAVDHDDPFADRVAIAFPEAMWDVLFPAPEREGEEEEKRTPSLALPREDAGEGTERRTPTVALARSSPIKTDAGEGK